MSNYSKTHIIFLIVLFLFTGKVFGLLTNTIPENQQTKIKEPQERAISLKLPLLQPFVNWTFINKEDFLSGKLVLGITRKNKTEQIVIFDNGQFSEGWEEISDINIPGRGEIYFGFISTKKYLTAPGDKLVLELTVKKDLPGIGDIQSGILPAGIYKSEGTYSGLIDEYDTSSIEERLSQNGEISDEMRKALDLAHLRNSNKAFMESWQEQWPLKITSEKGWLSEEQAALLRKNLEMIERLQAEAENRQVNLEIPRVSTSANSKYITRISGTVNDEKGEPVSGAFVTIPGIIQPKISSTNKNGKFLINVMSERITEEEFYLLVRHKERNLAAIKKLEDEKENLELTMSTGVPLSGKVVDTKGNGIHNAEIELIIWFPDRGTNWKEPVEIDEKGSFKINALPVGFRYTVRAQADGFGRNEVNVHTSQTPGDKYELEPIVLKVANMSVSGVVVDIYDNSVANAVIFLEDQNELYRDTITDKNGKFSIDKICAGKVRIEADKYAKPRLNGHVSVQAGSQNVKIVISEVDSSGKPVQAHSLINEPLPRIESLFHGFRPEKIKDKKVLVCFWDYEQRPSRNCILQLAKQAKQLKEKDVEVIAIQASKIELAPFDKWIQDNNITFPVGAIPLNQEQTRFDWGVKSLPWLILTDKNHIVIAEGFGIAELDEKLSK